MLYRVVRELPHWFTPCVQLFFKNSFCMSSFYVVVYCRPLLPRQFFIFHKTPLQKQSSSLCHHLVVEFARWVVLPGQSNLKVSMDLLQNPFHDPKKKLSYLRLVHKLWSLLLCFQSLFSIAFLTASVILHFEFGIQFCCPMTY